MWRFSRVWICLHRTAEIRTRRVFQHSFSSNKVLTFGFVPLYYDTKNGGRMEEDRTAGGARESYKEIRGNNLIKVLCSSHCCSINGLCLTSAWIGCHSIRSDHSRHSEACRVVVYFIPAFSELLWSSWVLLGTKNRKIERRRRRRRSQKKSQERLLEN